MRKLLVLFIVLLPACGQSNDPSPTAGAETPQVTKPDPKPSATPKPTPKPKPTPAPFMGPPEFQKWLDLFLQNGRYYGFNLDTSNLTIQFSDLPGRDQTVIGMCEPLLAAGPRVSIRKTWWDSHDQVAQRVLIFHELGHCVLLRKHLRLQQETGRPVSMMYPYILSAKVFVENRIEYLRELFSEENLEDGPEVHVHECEESDFGF